MLSIAALGDIGIGVLPQDLSASVQSSFNALRRAGGSDALFLATLTPQTQAGDPVTLRTASLDYLTGPTDAPANTQWPPTASEILRFRRAADLDALSGAAFPAAGTLSVQLTDQVAQWREYDWVDQPVVVELGRRDFNYPDFGTVFVGRTAGVTARRNAITVELADIRARFDAELQSTLYSGTGGLDGTESLRGTVKPVVFGTVRQAEPVLVDPARLIYQIHDGGVTSVSTVSDRGVALAGPFLVQNIEGSAPGAGAFTVELARGLIRLGSSPLGAVTCDCVGPGAGIVEIIKLIAARVGVTELDASALQETAGRLPAAAGLYVRSPLTASAAIDNLARGALLVWGADRQGKLTAYSARLPQQPAAVFDKNTIHDIRDLGPTVPAWRVSVGYRRNWRPLPAGDLAAAAQRDAEDFGREYRQTVREDVSIQTRVPTAREVVLNSPFDTEAAAIKLRDRAWDLLSRRRQRVAVTVSALPARLRLGETVRVDDGVWFPSAGSDFVIVGLEEVASRRETRLTLWG